MLAHKRSQAIEERLVDDKFQDPSKIRIRNATALDVPSLMSLERKCWKTNLQTEESLILGRVTETADHQWVAEGPDGTIVACLYTQRINGIDGLLAGTYDSNLKLHCNTGNILQLCAINVASDYVSTVKCCVF